MIKAAPPIPIDDQAVPPTSTKLTDLDIAVELDLATKWEDLHGVQDSSYEDIPERHRRIVGAALDGSNSSGTEMRDNSVADTVISEITASAKNLKRMRNNQNLLEDRCYRPIIHSLQNACTSNLCWSLPNIQKGLSDLDLHDPAIAQLLSLTYSTPLAAFPVSPKISLRSMTRLTSLPRELHQQILYNLSPDLTAASPKFYGSVFTSSSKQYASWNQLRRLAHLSTVALLRQLYTFGIDAPVFGILFRGFKASLHVDWWEESAGSILLKSALIPDATAKPDSDTESEEYVVRPKQWDLRRADDVFRFLGVLQRIKTYNLTTFTEEVSTFLSSWIDGNAADNFVPWKSEGGTQAMASFGEDFPITSSEPLDGDKTQIEDNSGEWSGWRWSKAKGGPGSSSISSGPSGSMGATEEEQAPSTAETSLIIEGTESSPASGVSILKQVVAIPQAGSPTVPRKEPSFACNISSPLANRNPIENAEHYN